MWAEDLFEAGALGLPEGFELGEGELGFGEFVVGEFDGVATALEEAAGGVGLDGAVAVGGAEFVEVFAAGGIDVAVAVAGDVDEEVAVFVAVVAAGDGDGGDHGWWVWTQAVEGGANSELGTRNAEWKSFVWLPSLWV